MFENIKFSIITICYNAKEELNRTLNSIITQTYKNYECIVIDGASEDDSIELIKQHPAITKYISEPDNGVYDAMNKGVVYSTGDVVGIINSDDVLFDENVFKTIVDNFDDDTDIIYADVLYCDNELKEVIRNYISGEQKTDYWCPAHPSMYVRREVFDKIGLYDLRYRVVADYDFMVRCNISGIKFKYVRQYFVKMRYGGLSNGLDGYIKDFIEVYKVLRKNRIKYPLSKTLARTVHTIIQIIRR